MIGGSMVAMVTPFKNGEVDYEKLEELIEFQINNGTHGIVPVGTTGESPTLSHKEHRDVIKFTADKVGKRIPVIAGTGSNSTKEAVNLTLFAKEAGADAALIVSPYYNKPTQDGLYNHFETIAGRVDLKIILYNVPGRTAVNIQPETAARLYENSPNIIGIKEATGSIQQACKVVSMCGDEFLVLSGEDALNYPILAIGGHGFITVTANIAPKDVADLYNLFKKGDFEAARKMHYKLMPLNDILFVESNPIPVKKALNLMGKINDEIKPPLYNLSKNNTEILKKTLSDYGLL